MFGCLFWEAYLKISLKIAMNTFALEPFFLIEIFRREIYCDAYTWILHIWD